jgi:hypothetical protein
MENNKLGEGNTQCLHFPALEHGDPAEFYPSIIVDYIAETGWLILRTKQSRINLAHGFSFLLLKSEK